MHCCKLSLYPISSKTNEPNLKKWQKKPSFEPDFGPYGPNSGHQNFSSKICLPQSLDILVSYYHVQYQKKPIVQYWENLVTDNRQTDGQTDQSDFIGRFPTNVEHPKSTEHFVDDKISQNRICGLQFLDDIPAKILKN